MSKEIEAAAAAIAARIKNSGFDGTLKFAIEDLGVVRVDGESVSTQDGPADCTISAPLETFQAMFEGDLDPTAAFMSGKITIDGDMGMAMRLGQMLG